MTDNIEMCCICEIQHEGAEMTEFMDGLYCPTCVKECTCGLCGEMSVVPNSASFELVVNTGAEKLQEKGSLCVTCLDEVAK